MINHYASAFLTLENELKKQKSKLVECKHNYKSISKVGEVVMMCSKCGKVR